MCIRPQLSLVSPRIYPSFTKPLLSRGLLTRQSLIPFPKAPSTSVGVTHRYCHWRHGPYGDRKICIVACFVLCGIASVAKYVCDKSNDSTPMVLSPLEGRAWAEACLKKYPEIKEYLINDREVDEQQVIDQKATLSQRLFGPRYPVFDELMASLFALKWMLDNGSKGYIDFTRDQPEEVKLSWSSFLALHAEVDKLLESECNTLSKNEIAQALEVAIVLSHLGKSKEVKARFQPDYVKDSKLDDSRTMLLLMGYGRVGHSKLDFPSYDQLPPPAKQLVFFAANATNFRQMMRLEGGPGMLDGLRRHTSDECRFSFVRLVQQCNFVGALDHVNYTQPVHDQIAHMISTIKSPNTSSLTAYQTILKRAGHPLGFITWTDPEDYVLTRIGVMFGCSTKQEGAQLKAAFKTLPKSSQEHIIAQLAGQPNDPVLSAPIGIPDLFKNVFNYHLAKEALTKENSLSETMREVLPFVADVLAKQQKLEMNNARIPLNFQSIAALISSSPQLLKNPFSIDLLGGVCLHVTGKP